jgi:hypothetical protein
MTNAQLKDIRESAKEVLRTGIELRRPFVNAQRMCIYFSAHTPDGSEMLYVEGTLDGMPHAWNTLDGKIVDLGVNRTHVVSEKDCARYEPFGSYTWMDCITNSQRMGGKWWWMCTDWMSADWRRRAQELEIESLRETRKF